MPYNCDKDGWVPIERTVSRRGVTDVEQDCVREGTELPGRWHAHGVSERVMSAAGPVRAWA